MESFKDDVQQFTKEAAEKLSKGIPLSAEDLKTLCLLNLIEEESHEKQ